jgi:hypothetical protein
MAMQELRTRLQNLWRQSAVSSVAQQSSSKSSSGRLRRRPITPWNHRSEPRQYAGRSSSSFRTTTGLDVARFGLLSIATLPFTSWVALFTYDYYYRVELCQEALSTTQHSQELQYSPSRSSNASSSSGQSPPPTMVGRETQFEEVRALLAKPPHQILVVAGPNESGKSRFVSSLLQTIDPKTQGVTYIQMSQIVDSLSTLTQGFVKGFHLQWLQLRYALVDVLPFAGSEILVMKERYSDRDLAQALGVVTDALQQNAKQKRHHSKGGHLLPVIVIDGLGEGGTFFRSREGRQSLQQILKWCITITKERGLAHVILTGNEELFISLTDQNRTTRGHVQVIGMSTLDATVAGPAIVHQEWPDASPAEIQKLTDTFGGFIHDLHTASRQIQQRLTQAAAPDTTTKKGKKERVVVSEERRAQIVDHVLSARFRLQVERVTAAFAKGKEESPVMDEEVDEAEAEDDMDPYLDPLKRTYSEAQAKKSDLANSSSSGVDARRKTASWSQLQLWRTLQRLVESSSSDGKMAVPFGDLRDEIFEGDITPLLELMNEDVLGFDFGGTSQGDSDSSSDSISWSWQIKPATPALGRVFQYLVHNSHLKERFQEMERIAERREKLALNDQERRQLRLECRSLDRRKASLLKTAELGNALDMGTEILSTNTGDVYKRIVAEEIALEQRGRLLRAERTLLLQGVPTSSTANSHDDRDQDAVLPPRPISDHVSIQNHLKTAILNTCEQEDGRTMKVRESFQRHARSEAGGVTASDVVRLIKESTGENISLEVAERFIWEWDANKDNRLDYDEFIEMILADASVKNNNSTKKKSKIAGSSNLVRR